MSGEKNPSPLAGERGSRAAAEGSGGASWLATDRGPKLWKRAVLAVFLTASSISLISGLSFYVTGVIYYGVRWLRYIQEPVFIAFMAFFFSLLPAILMTIVEWPKSKKFIQDVSRGFSEYCFISIAAASALPFFITILGWAVGAPKSAENWIGIISIIPVFMFGGLVSAIIWWNVVVRYARRNDQPASSGVTSV